MGREALIMCVAIFYIDVWLICIIVVRIRNQKSMILVQFLVELSSPRWQTISILNNIVCGKSSTATYHVRACKVLLSSLLCTPDAKS